MKVKVTHSCPTLCDPIDYTVQGTLQARLLEWVAFPSPGDLPNPGIELRSPTLQADSLPAEPQGKPKNTRVDSLSLLQGIFSTQESNWGLPHYRLILYQLGNQGSPGLLHIIPKISLYQLKKLKYREANNLLRITHNTTQCWFQDLIPGILLWWLRR